MPWFFIGLKYIPASKATLIFNLSPILIAIAAYFILKEELTKFKIVAVFGSFFGVFLFTLNKNSTQDSEDGYFIGIAWVFVTCVFMAFVALLIRSLNQHLHYAINPFWFGVTTTIESFLLLLIYRDAYNFSHYTWRDSIWFMISGVFNYGGQMFRSLAYKYEDASFLAPFQYFQVLYLVVWDFFLFQYTFSTTDIFGGIIITFFLLTPMIQEALADKNKKEEDS